MHWMAIGSLWALALVVVVIGGMSLWHLVTPPTWHLLEADQVSRLQTITVSSIVSALLTFVVQEATR